MTEALAAPPESATMAPRLTLVETPRRVPLNQRERDVLSLMADGLSTRDVARRMCYSERTIKNVLQELSARLHFRNRTHAVAYAVRRGWI